MADTLFGGLHEGALVHRLYLTAGTEVLNTSPATWIVTAIDDEYIELCDMTVQQSWPYMVDHLPVDTGSQYTTMVRVRKAAVVGIEFVIAYPAQPCRTACHPREYGETRAGVSQVLISR
jgi:hypothetical protein